MGRSGAAPLLRAEAEGERSGCGVVELADRLGRRPLQKRKKTQEPAGCRRYAGIARSRDCADMGRSGAAPLRGKEDPRPTLGKRGWGTRRTGYADSASGMMWGVG